jgi:hypothetical protein
METGPPTRSRISEAADFAEFGSRSNISRSLSHSPAIAWSKRPALVIAFILNILSIPGR